MSLLPLNPNGPRLLRDGGRGSSGFTVFPGCDGLAYVFRALLPRALPPPLTSLYYHPQHPDAPLYFCPVLNHELYDIMNSHIKSSCCGVLS